MVATPSDLPGGVLTERERDFFAGRGSAGSLPFTVTRHYLSLVDWSDPEDPIRRQCIPRREEHITLPYELSDPLGEELSAAVPRLVHRYADRVLLLVTDRCATYCRHCFRRRFTGRKNQAIRPAEAAAAAAYIEAHPEIRELIFSGGDPFMLTNERLFALLERFRRAEKNLAFRIHSRLPVVLPRRFTAPTLKKLSAFRPLRLVTQFNHARELSAASRQAVNGLLSHGIPVLNQAVLLRGVNNSPETQTALIRGLHEVGIIPYYLFQGDLAPGTSHLRVPLEEGLRLMKHLRAALPASLLPVYALDQPGLGGKIPLGEHSVLDRTACYFLLAAQDGKRFTYPVET
jgi:lysine 2,3-aminomutase